jgi:superfamily II DNA or RNA helicase
MIDYSYQIPLIDKIWHDLKTSGKPGVLGACPGAGKTRMALEIVVKKFLKETPNGKALIFTHGQVLLRDQWREVAVNVVKKHRATVVEKGKHAAKAIKDNHVILAIPQTLAKAKVETVDFLIVDEAHQRFLARQMQELICKLKPKYILLLTGTPSHYIGNPAYTVHGITLEELMDYGSVTDPMIEIVKGCDEYSLEDYDKSTWHLKEGHMTETATERTLDRILPQILRKLTSANRSKPEQFDWIKEIKSWKQLADKLQKSMIVCNDQRHAQDVHQYFAKRGVSSVLSISKLGDGVAELEKFKSDDSTRLFIVVNRGNIGFSFEELFNLIDLSGTQNVNRLFQMLCRLVRPSKDNPRQKKLFIKVTNQELQHLTFAVMSFVVALSTKRHYYSYTTQYRIDKIQEIPVPAKFMDRIEDDSAIKRLGPGINEEELPRLLTFTELKQKAPVGTIAYTNLKTVISKVYKNKKEEGYKIEHLETCMEQCQTRKEFERKFPSEYSWMKRKKLTKLLTEHFDDRSTWNKAKVLERAKDCLTMVEFRTRFVGAYNWARKNGALEEIKALYDFNPKELDIKSKDELIQKILSNKDYEVSETGAVFYRKALIKPRCKRGFVPYFVYEQDRYRISVPIPRLVYTKFRGPIPEDKVLAYKVVDKYSPRMSSLSNMYLKKAASG